jgi:hypothetical protein
LSIFFLVFCSSKLAFFYTCFQFWDQEKVCQQEIRSVGWLWNCWRFVFMRNFWVVLSWLKSCLSYFQIPAVSFRPFLVNAIKPSFQFSVLPDDIYKQLPTHTVIK